jgi:anti-sigma regulatory factor (Ser/Thr protein kinase)
MVVELEETGLDANDHVVHFYERDSGLADTVWRYLTRAARIGVAGIVIATEGHRRAIEAEMEAAGVDPATGRSYGTLILLDAAATLATFMIDGRIDRDAFRDVIGSVVRRAGETGRAVRVYGEMVALLWDTGNVLAAIELEELWNELGRELQFDLLCGYNSESVNGAEHEQALQQICHLHCAVLDAAGTNHRDAQWPAGAGVSANFPADLVAAGAARQFVTDSLTKTNLPVTSIDDARLIVTELAANAIVHARSPFSVTVHAHGCGVRLSVRDGSSVRPTVRPCDPRAESGRGLLLVAALSADWGVVVALDGKTVWADLRV